jgi:hypothetical protein
MPIVTGPSPAQLSLEDEPGSVANLAAQEQVPRHRLDRLRALLSCGGPSAAPAGRWANRLIAVLFDVFKHGYISAQPLMTSTRLP